MNLQSETLIIFIFRLFFGVLFISSSTGKFFNYREFTKAILDYRILPLPVANIYASLLPWIELGISVALFVNFAGILVMAVIFFLILSFNIAIVANLVRQSDLECHCYGVLGNNPVGWGTVVRNFFLLSLALIYITTANLHTNDWLTSWQIDLLVLSSIEIILPVILLIIFGFVSIRLIEESINIGYRSIKIRSRNLLDWNTRVYFLPNLEK